MSHCGYSTSTEGTVALAAGVAKTILGVRGNAAFGLDLKNWAISFDGITAAAAPVLVEVMYATFATNAPGTASTASTIDQRYGRTQASGITGAKNWTTEPTVLTGLVEILIDPYKGALIYDWPLGETPDTDVSHGFVIRCTAPAAVNARAGFRFERA
jgi:hypothetical protein